MSVYDNELGQIDGDRCNRNGCVGVIKEWSPESCSCHLRAPCGACLTPRGYCETCGWEVADD